MRIHILQHNCITITGNINEVTSLAIKYASDLSTEKLDITNDGKNITIEFWTLMLDPYNWIKEASQNFSDITFVLNSTYCIEGYKYTVINGELIKAIEWTYHNDGDEYGNDTAYESYVEHEVFPNLPTPLEAWQLPNW
jgi:hypothetical protein